MRSAWALCVAATMACASSERSPGVVDAAGGADAPVDAATSLCTRDLDCNDGIACSIDHCEADGSCSRVPCLDCCGAGYECTTDLGCTTERTPCTMDAECVDAVACTLDRCLDGTFCEHQPQSALCPPEEICFAALGCIPTPPADCVTNEDCFADQPCLGEWSCLEEFGCQFERPLDCDDGNDCTADLCDDALGGCVHDAPVEICNGVDDDCDSSIDEGFTCIAGTPDLPCATACGTTGTQDCQADCTLTACTPPPETCSGIDDDCDGLVDEGFACVAGTSGSCATICGSTGSRDCLGDCTYDTCVPPAETCNGVDDDCDAAPDDGFDCVRGAAIGSCTTTCGSVGTEMCSDTCTAGSCVPPPETCNGLDDDCDGSADETFPCVAGASLGSCTTSCGSTGSSTCTASCAVGTCTPPAETCNGVDDDCDAAADETFACVQGATVDCGVLGAGAGTAVCRSDCTGWDTSGCAAGFDPSGTYVCTPAPSYSCVFGIVSFDISTMTFSDSGAILIVSGAPCTMTGASASGGDIDVSCTLTGSCDEIYALTGSFTGPDTWTGTFTATFSPDYAGACYDCTDQSFPTTGMR